MRVELRDLGLDLLVQEGVQVGLEVDIDLAGGHEGAHVFDVDLQAALVDAGDDAFDDLADLQVFPAHVLRRGAFLI